jgi:glycosyltransferase involved in cell wall biosynthesis
MDEPTFRYRTENVIRGLQKRGWDADQLLNLSDSFEVGVIHCFSSLVNALKIRRKSEILIYDVNDNLFFLEDDYMCSRFLAQSSDMIICASQYLMKRYRPLNKNCFWIPDLIDYAGNIESNREQSENADDEVIIVWMGHRDNVRYLEKVRIPLMAISRKYPMILKVITSETEDSMYPTIEKLKGWMPSVKIRFVKWMRETFMDELINSDIAIAPLFNNEFCKSKSENKLISYMNAGLPVIASSILSYENIVQDGYNGFLADTDEEWQGVLEKLIADRELRCSVKERGKKTTKYFEENNIISMWEAVFKSVRQMFC